jgi:hypothetical protein
LTVADRDSVGCAEVMEHLEKATDDKLEARMKVAAKTNGIAYKTWDAILNRG